MSEIVITVGSISLRAELNDSPTAQLVWAALPITGNASVWGDEIYFEIPVTAGEEPDARADVEIGTLGFWPVGNAFCIFFGPTPVSRGPQPRAYSPVNILGKVMGDATVLRGVKSGTPVKIAKA